ncbi:MAG: PIN domain-containing protein [Calditrichaceae bacterium]|nr:PIN domain-containing protein [Calditrichaceae bacterium]MBN2707597.1 PIN domain-containing protein [Calditrichaceae bacterium]RQV93225.1 MAG: PIN domain nuclease [Calditrichota bacterium]
MKVIVDTCVWSLALRRDVASNQKIVKELSELIKDVRVQLIGPIRQEILSGIKSDLQFSELRDYLSVFMDLPIETIDYEKAAEFYNTCRKKGIQVSNIDFLICALAFHRDFEIFTLDKDFENIQKIIPIKLYKIMDV